MTEINTQVYIDLTMMHTVNDVLRALTMAAYHHGNWQKDFGPENIEPFEKRIQEITNKNEKSSTSITPL